jgi:competence protein ComEA
LLLAVGLLAWRTLEATRWGLRPTTLEPDASALRVDLNSADHARLLQLPGVGESLARRIEEYREQYGRFRDVDELRGVSGIGPATLERLRPFVCAQSAPGTADRDELTDGETEVVEPPPVPVAKPRSAVATVSRKVDGFVQRIDLNRATVEELQRLPGIGPAMSDRIVTAREEKPFRAVDDLRRVRGIGPKTLERLRPYVTVDD